MGKKKCFMIAAGILLLLFMIFQPGVKKQSKNELRNKAEGAVVQVARMVAGRGMLQLVEDSREDSRESKRAALTFDDGPDKRYTPLLLEELKKQGVHATFFLIGNKIEGNEALVKQMEEEGHLIGNHTFNHVQLNKLSPEKAKEEMEKAANRIYEVTGTYPAYIRPPFGAWRKNMELSVTMLPVLWDIDTLDWKSKNVNSILQIVQTQLHDGAIILMHDEYKTSVEAAIQVIAYLKQQNYELVTVDELLVP